jgi:hypothetical protein
VLWRRRDADRRAASAGGGVGASIGSGLVHALLPSVPLIILGFGGWLLVLISRVAGKRSVQDAPFGYSYP